MTKFEGGTSRINGNNQGILSNKTFAAFSVLNKNKSVKRNESETRTLSKKDEKEFLENPFNFRPS